MALINERCLEMQKGCSAKATQVSEGRTVKKQKNGDATNKCSFYAPVKIETTRDLILTQLLDIEELVDVSTNTNACPYYAARLAAKEAQVVMLSYQMLLHRRTRLQNGLKLRDSIVIIDEGHNLIDTISSIYSNEVTLDQLRRAAQQLVAYKKRYFSRFSTKNLLYLNQLIFITNRLVFQLEHPPALKGGSTAPSRMILPLDLITESDFSTIRLNEILDFCDRNRLAQKVHGFSQKYGTVEVQVQPATKPTRSEYLQKLSQKVTTKEKPTVQVSKENVIPVAVIDANSSGSSVIRPLLAFLDCLLERIEDGRVLMTYNQSLQSKSSMKYLLLNPAGHFADVLSECRSVGLIVLCNLIFLIFQL